MEQATSSLTIAADGFEEVYFGVTTMCYSWADVSEFAIGTYFFKPTVAFVDKHSKKRHLCYGRIFIYGGDLTTLAQLLNRAVQEL